MLRIKASFFQFNEGFLGDSKQSLEEAFLAQARERWKDEEDPKGRNWKARKDPSGSWPILRKTGKLQETAKVFFNERTGFTAKVVPYGVFQNRVRPLFGVDQQFINTARKILCRKILKVKRVELRQ